MAFTPFKVLVVLASGCSAAAAAAYVSDVFDPYLPATLGRPAVPQVTAPTLRLQPGDLDRPAAVAPAPAPAAVKQMSSPSFDLVRVEADGSIVVAGKAAPGAKVELAAGERIIGEAVAGAEGDFAIVIDEPLKPGEYQLMLRSTTAQNAVELSTQTAVVSIPQSAQGQVLVMVEEAGKASRLITVPKAAPVELAAAATPRPQTVSVSASQGADASKPTGPKIAVEAVEIEGSKIFVAGVADPGRKVRAYVDDVLLGLADSAPDGHFLVEASRDLAVGDHVFRVEALSADRTKVVAQAAVPFRRAPGQAATAVASASAPQTTGAGPGSSEIAGTSETLAAEAGNVIIRRGDTLWEISQRVYGNGLRYSAIYLANQTQIANPDRIWPGQVFKVPQQTAEREAANMEAVGGQAGNGGVAK